MENGQIILERVSEWINRLGLHALRPQVEACARYLNAHDGVDVAILGRFKAGKSSFLNHLLGRPVLPIGVVPLTAVITRLRYGEPERMEVRYLDGRLEEAPIADIGRYVDEKQNPNNTKGVASVTVTLPELKPLFPLQFVDTPGLGSALTHNTEVALNWLPNVGAALVAISADAPLSERDLALLKELRRHTPKIVVLLTKADLLTEPQRAEVLAFVRAALQRHFSPTEPETLPAASAPPADGANSTHSPAGRASTPSAPPVSNTPFPVFFYSIRPELAPLRTALIEQLLQPLIQRRRETARHILMHKLGALTDQLLEYVEVALAAATQSDLQRRQLRALLEEEHSQWTLFREELYSFAHQAAAELLEGYLRELENDHKTLKQRAAARFDQQYSAWRLAFPPLMNAWRQWLRDFLQAELQRLSRERHALFCAPLHRVAAHLTRSVGAFHARLAAHVQAALGMTLSPRVWKPDVAEPTAPPIEVGYAFDASAEIAGYLVPMFLVRRAVGRILARKTLWEVEKNISRLAAAWRDRVARTILELAQEAEREARAELELLTRSLEQKPETAPALATVRDELRALQTRLRSPSNLEPA